MPLPVRKMHTQQKVSQLARHLGGLLFVGEDRKQCSAHALHE